MSSIYSYAISLVLGSVVGSLSGYSLIRQVSAYSATSSGYHFVLTILRLGSLSIIAWYLLQWGQIPFILFGGSLMITKWIAILCLNE